MEKAPEESCLTTREALHRLQREVELVLHQFKSSQKNRKNKSWIKDTLNHSSPYSRIKWVAIAFQLWVVGTYLTFFAVEGDDWMVMGQAFIVLALLALNLCLELYENKLRHDEVPNRVQSVLDMIKNETDNIKWKPENYPNLCSPFSPCITMQWTYRDNNLINLPWALLVKDDVILVRPGQHSPGYCEAIDKNTEYQLLHAKEIYAPSLQNANEIFSAPKSRRPLECKKYKLLETPFLNNLRIYLEQALDRPISHLNQQRHLVISKIIEGVIMPFIFGVAFIASLLKYFCYNLIPDEMLLYSFLIVPSTTILPLLPLIFPIAWNLLNYIGMARFATIFDTTRNCDTKIYPLDVDTEIYQLDVDTETYKLEEDTETTILTNSELSCNQKEIWNKFWEIFRGKSDILCRSANILHALGSVTALGCVDKKGILSWPNPTSEKLFFLHNNDNISSSSSLDNVGDLSTDVDSISGTPHHNHHHHHLESPDAAVAEVLDLTHNHSDPFKLHFDDPDWHKHLTSLKPLGLAILLNTCNVDTQEQYSTFCSHITCEAMYNENLVPVTNRRCLCELAKEIGFVDQAQKIFALEQTLSTFRHLQPEMVRRDNKYARSLQLSTKLKFPFPHMFAVVVKELSSGSIQLLSEGTADIVLDSCVDYWDGHDLCPMTPTDRKKIQDFYQRSSLTAYCTAFAYRPLNKSINNKLSEVYLELPSDSRHLYMNYRSPTPVHWECKSVLEPKIRSNLGQFYSTDSLLYNDYPSDAVSDTESCFHMQCNQVFIGMVAMQYQPLTDMVQLIEHLEGACIRFVHFSKENELRSRVFSEKMGLESGWNCHISLLSERNRRDSGQVECTVCTNPRQDVQRRLSQSDRKLTTAYDDKSCLFIDSNLESSRAMSFSAPSAINMEQPSVKFDTDDVNKIIIEQEEVCRMNKNTSSRDSVQIHNELNSTTHEWQSLSCLTDSTEQSAPINFDMSNRAKLPRGIDKIRPHIELIDNVPLLVSLFTDCTSSATREMLAIMQEYGEVVCIMGSSANNENAGIFMQADASIAVNPLYPQVCQKMKAYKNPKTCISPIDLASQLNSVACSINVKREDPISFYHLIMESRHFVTILWNSVQFWLSCSVVLSLMQLIVWILMLPPLFTSGQVLWLSCAVIPLLSVSLMLLPVDPEMMKKPQGKNQIGINWNNSIFIIWCYGGKFLPTIVVVVASFIGILSNHCEELCQIRNCTCHFFYIPSNGGWDATSWTILTARLVILFIVLLHFVMISVGFVYRNYLIIQKCPTNNLLWLTVIFILVILQSFYTLLNFINNRTNINVDKYQIPIWVIIFAASSPLIVLFLNETIKYQEIKVNKRFEKRARLDFGTKLGMNSPF